MGLDEKENYMSIILGTFFPILAYGTIFLAIFNAPWFNWKLNALSDLGIAPGSSLIFNNGLILSGLLYVFFILLLFKRGCKYIVCFGYLILMVSGISLMLVGVFLENVKVPHLMAAWGYFLFFPIGAVITSLGETRDNGDTPMLVLAVVALLIFVTVLIIPWRTFGVKGLAIPEIIAATSNMVWHLYYTARKVFVM